jgi:hypothetical protein
MTFKKKKGEWLYNVHCLGFKIIVRVQVSESYIIKATMDDETSWAAPAHSAGGVQCPTHPMCCLRV